MSEDKSPRQSGLPAPISAPSVTYRRTDHVRGATLSRGLPGPLGLWTRSQGPKRFDGTLALSPLCVKEDALPTGLQFYNEMLFYFNCIVVDQTLHNKPQIGAQPAPKESI